MFFMSHLLRGHAIIPPKKLSEYLFILKVSRDKILMLLIFYQFLFSFPAFFVAAKGLFTKNLEREKTKGWFLLPCLHKFPTVFRKIF